MDALYGTVLDLYARGFLGPETRHPVIGAAWRRLLPAVPRLVAAEPASIAGAVTNAVHALAIVPGSRPASWIERMVVLGPLCADLAIFRDAGAVVAWQCGMAHLRPAALDAAARLPVAIAAPSLGLPVTDAAGIAAVLARLRDDSWLEPGAAVRPAGGPRELRVVARAGAFRGFGGPFIEPPTVRSSSGGALYASDRDAAWRLHADRFGTVFRRVGPAKIALPPGDPAAVRVDRNGKVAFAGIEGVFPELAEATSTASDGRTAAVTVRSSHAVILVAPVDVPR